MNEPVRLTLPGRTLLLVAGMPGAGKSTLLAGLPPRDDVVVLDSDAHRVALRGLLPGVPYAAYRPLVHFRHRLAVLAATFSAAPTVVVHLPATDRGTRTAVARLAALTGRTAHLLWLRVDPTDARRGQRERGRLVREASFAVHAERAARPPGAGEGWATVTVLDRMGARAGLLLETGAPAQVGS
jgi:predicted kinase